MVILRVAVYTGFTVRSVVPRSRFLGDTDVLLPEFLGVICKFLMTHQIYLIFTCKIEYSFREISVHYLFKFELDVISFGARRDDSEVVSAIGVVVNSPANLQFMYQNSFFWHSGVKNSLFLPLLLYWTG